jgi:hypothetical protein
MTNLQQKEPIQQVVRLVLSKSDVCIVVQAENFRHVIDWQATYIHHVTLLKQNIKP